MLPNDDKIKAALLAGKYVTEEDIAKADDFAKDHHARFLDYFFEQNLITKDLLGQALAEYFQIPYGDLNSRQPPREQVLKIPEQIAATYRAVLFEENAQGLTVATDAPGEKKINEELTKIFPGKKITLVYSLPEDIDEALRHYRKPLETRFAKIIDEGVKVAPEIIDEIIEDSLALRASDIHFEPLEKEVLIRFRIDGILHEAGRIPEAYYENILNRLKVHARLRVDEHFSAQDGAIRYETKESSVDLRISIMPTLDGEKIAIRVLAEYVRGFVLDELGLAPTHQNLIQSAARKPFGMIVVTGPTGSGKTTTLYALIKSLNRPEVNITTIEDPVEYKIAGVNQIQVNLQTNLTFAKGLRSIVRQDPDVILVGEIRDLETAEIAVNAALTGHLLFSTFHANDSATTIPRMLDMGVEPFLLASTLELITAQRLVRKICESCRYSQSVSLKDITTILSEAARYFPQEPFTLYRGKGCKSCGDTGYRGRIALFELIRNTPSLQDLILRRPSAKEVRALARKEGATNLFEDGVEKVKNGITTLEELLRVAEPPTLPSDTPSSSADGKKSSKTK